MLVINDELDLRFCRIVDAEMGYHTHPCLEENDTEL